MEGREEYLRELKTALSATEADWGSGDGYGPPEHAPTDLGAGEDIAVGAHGRLMLYGGPQTSPAPNRSDQLKPFAHTASQASGKRVALVLGYPAFDAPMLQFAFEKAGAVVDVFDRTWLPPDKFKNYQCVAVLGNTVRAKMEPSGFSVSEQDVVRNYLESGGKMFIGRELFRYLFPGDEGQRFVSSLLGPRPVGDRIAFRTLHPNHPWLRHLDDNEWVNHPSMSPVGVSKGQNLISETETSRSVLASIPVGRGQLIYCGWNLSRWQPSGRAESSLEQESAYDDQYRIYEEIVSDLLKESPVGG